jgi:PPOX class probable F420-dependent enzyme
MLVELGGALSTAIDSRARRLLDGPNMAHVATVDHQGHPRIQPVWIGTDGETIWINTQDGRTWPKRLRRDPRVAISILNAEAPTEYVEIVGHLAEETSDGAKDHLDALSRVYTQADYPNHFEGEVRVIFRIAPDRINYVNLLEAIPGAPGPAAG